ncbi:hypothetical protein COOONC_14935 [Cooperia oncophora]
MVSSTFHLLVGISLILSIRCGNEIYPDDQESMETSVEEPRNLDSSNDLQPHYTESWEDPTSTPSAALTTTEGSGLLPIGHKQPQFKRLRPIGFSNEAFIDISDDFTDISDHSESGDIDTTDATTVVDYPEPHTQFVDESDPFPTPNTIPIPTSSPKMSRTTTRPFIPEKHTTMTLQPFSEAVAVITPLTSPREPSTGSQTTPLNQPLPISLPFTKDTFISRPLSKKSSTTSNPAHSATLHHPFKGTSVTYRPFRSKINDGEVRHHQNVLHKRRSGLTSGKILKPKKKYSTKRALQPVYRARGRRLVSHDVPLPTKKLTTTYRRGESTPTTRKQRYRSYRTDQKGFTIKIRRSLLG